MPYEGEVSPQNRRGVSDARLLAEAAALKRFSRRTFLAGAGASGLLAADMLVTREVQSQRRSTRILSVPDDFADAYYPDARLVPVPRIQNQREEAQWILNTLRGSLNKRARLAAVGYSNLGLNITEVVNAITDYVAAEKITKLFFYGHSFGGMLATQVAARLLALQGIQVQFILLDSSPYSAHDVLDQSWFDGVVFLYESGVRFPSTLRGGYELGERIIHKDERSLAPDPEPDAGTALTDRPVQRPGPDGVRVHLPLRGKPVRREARHSQDGIHRQPERRDCGLRDRGRDLGGGLQGQHGFQ
ncbi:hypothetical protein NG819_00955 [Pseudarthrobacter sp. Fe7]|nr:hypothetical protein NG819_00955 [Pseudarthrobacter sp. Fe7]